ncbi:MAG: 3-isopropylmalate dehydrogenase [Spirochaetes bacterium GWF1_51_8]|nr:MAG: 3-isopropylmalate dehydrogenase [Spirochaetes bacterium GWF1_51_8]
MATHNIAVLGGDGTGPEVVAEGVKVLKAVASKFKIGLDFHYYDFGGDRYLKTGKIIDSDDINELRKYSAIFLGAIGHPDVKPGILEKGLLLRLRFELDQYINLRPVKLYPGVETPVKDKGPDEVDFVVIRENSGGIYTGHGGATQVGNEHEIATQVMVYDRFTVDRCLKYAFELKKKRNKLDKKYADKPIHLVHKTNVLTFTGDLWFRAYNEMGEKNYPEFKRDYAHVDATTMWFVKNPEWFDVIVTENLFGDIITDLGAMVQGGMGIAAGGNINPEGVSMFEPIGGSAPKYTGKHVINPLAAIEAGRMMLDELGETDAAMAIQKSVANACTKMKSQAAGKMGYTTEEVGDLVASNL